MVPVRTRNPDAVARGHLLGARGGYARAKVLSPGCRSEIDCIAGRENEVSRAKTMPDKVVHQRGHVELLQIAAAIDDLIRRRDELCAIIDSRDIRTGVEAEESCANVDAHEQVDKRLA